MLMASKRYLASACLNVKSAEKHERRYVLKSPNFSRIKILLVFPETQHYLLDSLNLIDLHYEQRPFVVHTKKVREFYLLFTEKTQRSHHLELKYPEVRYT